MITQVLTIKLNICFVILMHVSQNVLKTMKIMKAQGT